MSRIQESNLGLLLDVKNRTETQQFKRRMHLYYSAFIRPSGNYWIIGIIELLVLIWIIGNFVSISYCSCDVASSYSRMGTFRPNHPIRPLLSNLAFCFLILSVWDDFSFYLQSWHEKILAFDHFLYILECLFSFLCFLVCVCV